MSYYQGPNDFSGAEGGPYTMNPDGSWTFTGGAYQGVTFKVNPATGYAEPYNNGGGGFQQGASPFGNPMSGWQTAAMVAAPLLAAGGGAFLGGGGGGGGAAAASAPGTVTSTLPITATGIDAGTDAGLGGPAAISSLPALSTGVSSVLPNLAKLATGGVGLGLTLASRNQASQANAPLLAALNTLLPQLQQRVTATQPLFNNVVNMAHGMLPKAYQ